MTMLIVEQNLSFARQCTARLYAIAQGAVRFTGTWSEFAASGELIGSYL